jgi:hypothetical protein
MAFVVNEYSILIAVRQIQIILLWRNSNLHSRHLPRHSPLQLLPRCPVPFEEDGVHSTHRRDYGRPHTHLEA